MTDATDTLDLLLENNTAFRDWFPGMEVTVVAYRDEELFQAFQASYYHQHGEQYCYTISDWLSLAHSEKAELVGKRLMLIKPRSEQIGLSGSLMYLARRVYVQRGQEFITLKDATGVSGASYNPSHSY